MILYTNKPLSLSLGGEYFREQGRVKLSCHIDAAYSAVRIYNALSPSIKNLWKKRKHFSPFKMLYYPAWKQTIYRNFASSRVLVSALQLLLNQKFVTWHKPGTQLWISTYNIHSASLGGAGSLGYRPLPANLSKFCKNIKTSQFT